MSTLLSEFLGISKKNDLTCNECKSEWKVNSIGCTIQWEDQGVEWIDFELSCNCDIEELADDDPYPCVRYDGKSITFFTKQLPIENTTKIIKIEENNTDSEEDDLPTQIWHNIGEHIGIPDNHYWHWSKKWHEHTHNLMRGFCPKCQNRLRIIGDDLFCLNCDFDTLKPLNPKKEIK